MYPLQRFLSLVMLQYSFLRLERSSPRDGAPGFESTENPGPAVGEEQTPEALEDEALRQRQFNRWRGQSGAKGERPWPFSDLQRWAVSLFLQFIDFSAARFCALVGNSWNSSLFCLQNPYSTQYTVVIQILSVLIQCTNQEHYPRCHISWWWFWYSAVVSPSGE